MLQVDKACARGEACDIKSYFLMGIFPLLQAQRNSTHHVLKAKQNYRKK